MNEIRPIAETHDTVTLRRADYETLLEEVEEAADIAAAREAETRVAAGESEYLPIAMVERLAAGESPVRVWRQHRGMSAHALAQAAALSPSYLSEIERGRKPGSLETMIRLAKALRVSLDDLTAVKISP